MVAAEILLFYLLYIIYNKKLPILPHSCYTDGGIAEDGQPAWPADAMVATMCV
jgi:hypothetical protein